MPLENWGKYGRVSLEDMVKETINLKTKKLLMSLTF